MVQLRDFAQRWPVLGFGRESKGTPQLGFQLCRVLPVCVLSPRTCTPSSHSQLSKGFLFSEPQFPHVNNGLSTPSATPPQSLQATSGHPGASPVLAQPPLSECRK